MTSATSTRVGEPPEVDLVRLLVERIPLPVDSLELAAVIESSGINDDIARMQYEAEDVFELAERVYPAVIRVANRRAPIVTRTTGQGSDSDLRSDMSSRGFLAVSIVGLLFVLLIVVSRLGWSIGWTLALSFGAIIAMVVTSGPLLVIARQASLYLGLGQYDSARRFTLVSCAVTAAACVIVALVLLALGWMLGVAAPSERIVLTVSIVAYGLVWILASAPTLRGHARRAVGCFVGSLVLAVSIGIVAGSSAGLVSGYFACLFTLSVGWRKTFGSEETRRHQLPRLVRLAVEGGLYLLYGVAFSLLFLVPHVMGWLGNGGVSIVRNLQTFELSFVLAFPPAVLVSGIHEVALECFWKSMRDRISYADQISFNSGLSRLHRHQVVRYLGLLGIASASAIIVVESVVISGRLQGMSQLVFLLAIVAMGLLGIGQLNAMFLLSLSQPGVALAVTVLGLVIVTGLGVPLVLIDYRLAAVAAAVGAAVYAGGTLLGCRRLFGLADHHYSRVF